MSELYRRLEADSWIEFPGPLGENPLCGFLEKMHDEFSDDGVPIDAPLIRHLVIMETYDRKTRKWSGGAETNVENLEIRGGRIVPSGTYRMLGCSEVKFDTFRREENDNLTTVDGIKLVVGKLSPQEEEFYEGYITFAEDLKQFVKEYFAQQPLDT